MITQARNGDAVLSYGIAHDYAEVLGEYRVAKIDEVVQAMILTQAHNSLILGFTGAHRWPTQFRPEVQMDATGRLL